MSTGTSNVQYWFDNKIRVYDEHIKQLWRNINDMVKRIDGIPPRNNVDVDDVVDIDIEQLRSEVTRIEKSVAKLIADNQHVSDILRRLNQGIAALRTMSSELSSKIDALTAAAAALSTAIDANTSALVTVTELVTGISARVTKLVNDFDGHWGKNRGGPYHDYTKYNLEVNQVMSLTGQFRYDGNTTGALTFGYVTIGIWPLRTEYFAMFNSSVTGTLAGIQTGGQCSAYLGNLNIGTWKPGPVS